VLRTLSFAAALLAVLALEDMRWQLVFKRTRGHRQQHRAPVRSRSPLLGGQTRRLGSPHSTPDYALQTVLDARSRWRGFLEGSGKVDRKE
jgi:hypothetical protein